VLYQCKNVKGYQEAMERVRVTNPTAQDDEIHRHLCEDSEFAHESGFDGAEFAKSKYPVDDSSAFDLDSIMLYGSTVFANKDQCPQDPKACPLLKYDPPGQLVITSFCQHNQIPSDGDAAWIKKWYPHIGILPMVPPDSSPEGSPEEW
jgi:hypothetical protein